MSEITGQSADNNPSLLAEIRQTERKIARELAAAREAAARALEEASVQARHITTQAAENGRLEGEAARRKAMEAIELEATAIIAQAEKQADSLRHINEDALAAAANQAVKIITGTTVDKQ